MAVSGVTFDAAGNPVFDNVHRDFAPDLGHGFFSYQVLTKLVLTVTAFTTSPKPPKAGRTFSVSLAATENDTKGPVRAGTVACPATLAGKRAVAVTHVVANGIATCVWRIPKTAKGRIMRGTITLTVQGAHVTRPFAARITSSLRPARRPTGRRGGRRACRAGSCRSGRGCRSQPTRRRRSRVPWKRSGRFVLVRRSFPVSVTPGAIE